VRTLPEVKAASSIRLGIAEVDGKPGMLTAVEPSIATMFELGFTAGSLEDLGVDGVAVSAEKAKAKGWEIGSSVPLTFAETGERPFVVRAIYDNRELAGDAVVSQQAWEANVADQFDAQVFVLAADGVSGAKLRTAVEKAAAPYPTAKVQDLSEFKESQAGQINQMLGLIYALLGLAILIAVLGIANTLALSIFERTRELGLLRAVGMTRPQLRSAVRWESVLIALFGTGLGLVIGIAFGSAMVLSLADDGFGDVVIPGGQLAVIALLAALCGIAAALLPARRAAKLDVLGAIAAA
jgi:putative ABC transport system permease protein